ncbi:380_t:CDS:2 [Cetraspora pellucida]|uniref:380_t:CDS:1 n=1 Tax=Cetraspora pellucida TaxID=1433469 RepID=A0A9N9H087_9GLOM|nr:380_t:CDS:2 [Cetraspora pellucida]
MSFHTTVIIIIVTKEDFISLTQGFAKYQMSKNDFSVVRWKYFYPFNQPYTEFSIGDIIMFMDKFIVENLEQYISVSYACVVVANDPDREFEANEIPLSTPHCMFPALVSCKPKDCRESTYFDARYYQYNSNMNSRNVHMKLRIFYPTNALRFSYLHVNHSIKIGRMFIVSGFVKRITSDFIIVKLTDLDFISTNANTIQDVQVSTSSIASDNQSDIDLITEDVNSTTSQVLKRSHVIMSRSSKQSTSSSSVTSNSTTPFPTSITPININSETFQIQKEKINYVLKDDVLEYLHEQNVEEEQIKKEVRES